MSPSPDQVGRDESAVESEELSRLSELGLLAAVTAHDFNNVLSVILGCSSLLRLSTGLTPAQICELDDIDGGVRHGAELVRQLISYGRQPPSRSGGADINKILTQMGWILRHLGRNKTPVDLLLSPGLGLVSAPEIHLERVVLNLAINAAAAMPNGGQIIIETANVRVAAADDGLRALIGPGEYVLLAVSDTGLGMSDEVQARLFQPFYTTKRAGTGLGLYSVRRLARECGGDVRVRSRLGEGSTFEVFFPRRAA